MWLITLIGYTTCAVLNIYVIFSHFINFAYGNVSSYIGYVNGWSTVKRKLHNLLTYSINFAILLGYL